MSALDTAMRTYEVLAALHALPEKAALTTQEAALFLRLSPKTMERMRLDGSGPIYIQGGAKGARGGNQKCVYFKEDLLSWQGANQVSNAMQAAVRKGQAFMSISALAAEEPFYVDGAGRIERSALDASLETVIARVGSDRWAIEWLAPVEAASRQWSTLQGHSEFAEVVSSALRACLAKIDAASEATEIDNFVRGAR